MLPARRLRHAELYEWIKKRKSYWAIPLMMKEASLVLQTIAASRMVEAMNFFCVENGMGLNIKNDETCRRVAWADR